jgi:transcriptional regulator with XRE-family HTH domain
MAKSTKKKIGKPTKYKPEYCQMLIDHMSQGLSYESFAAILGVARSSLYEWEKMFPAYSDSKSIGKEKLLLFFEKMGLEAMTGQIPGFNAPTYIFTLKNKVGWSDKHEVEQNNKIEISISDEDKEL